MSTTAVRPLTFLDPSAIRPLPILLIILLYTTLCTDHPKTVDNALGDDVIDEDDDDDDGDEGDERCRYELAAVHGHGGYR